MKDEANSERTHALMALWNAPRDSPQGERVSPQGEQALPQGEQMFCQRCL